ncbi:Eco57I restriction-modification methylase domain-containing protein [Facklamia sp. P12950]|uniref:Eco57I restriction-modification methylase domain-containing protein n=1 Tax=Facklamia sp. P12950 TaxID=3421951 RepID=UPI003D1874B8
MSDKYTHEKKHGVVYTPQGMADYLTTLMLSQVNYSDFGEKIYILEPALGEGILLDTLLTQMPKDKEIVVYAFETDQQICEATNEYFDRKYPDIKFNIYSDDFVDYFSEKRFGQTRFDFIIANPPYVRTQVLGAEESQRLQKMFSLSGRVDFYYVFLIIANFLLSDNGVSGFITSNKFMSIKAGADLRKQLIKYSSLKIITDFGDTKLFDAAVLPCILVFKKGNTVPENVVFTSIYETSAKNIKTSVSAEDFDYGKLFQTGKIRYLGKEFLIEKGELRIDDENFTWTIQTEESKQFLDVVEKHSYGTIKDISKVKVGVKTTADNVFLFNYVPNNLKLIRPLITHRNSGHIKGIEEPEWSILYPYYDSDGKRTLYDLEHFPEDKDYLEQYRNQLSGRNYLNKAGREWYEIWVPHQPKDWKKTKIVFRDIAENPTFWIDDTGSVVNGDCYWISFNEDISEEMILLILGVMNSEFIKELYDYKYNNRIYARKRRFNTQYVENFPFPNPKLKKSQEIIELVDSLISSDSVNFNDIEKELNNMVYEVFGFSRQRN